MGQHKYTDEEKTFFREFVPGHSHKEIRDAFEARFGWPIEVSQVKGYIANHKLNTGRTGRFEKGRVPLNKGKKGICASGCEKTWFPKGNVPQNHKPVGTESIRNNYKRGQKYVYVKVAEPNRWRMKHVVVWEQHNGPVPKGKVIIFADGDTLNCGIDNLRLIDRATHVVMNRTGLCKYGKGFKDTAILIADLKCGVSSAGKRKGGLRDEES